MAGTCIIHEIAAELGQFWILTHPEHGRLSWLAALLINSASSVLTVIGAWGQGPGYWNRQGRVVLWDRGSNERATTQCKGRSGSDRSSTASL